MNSAVRRPSRAPRRSRCRAGAGPSTFSSPRTSSTPVLVWISIFGLRERALDHDPARPELVAPVEHVDLRREAGQVGRLLERGVAAADDRDLLVAEEEAVARGAGGHAAAAQPRLALEPQPHRRRAGRDDDRLGLVLDAARPDPERALREVDPVDVDVDDVRAEALRLLAEQGHQVRALDAVGEARVVLDVAREHQLAAGRRARRARSARGSRGPRRSRRSGRPARSRR